jgi:hypothetical protein
MDNQEYRARPYGSHRDPAFLLARLVVSLGQCVGIVENQNRSFKANIMLAEVYAVLVCVPFKSHGGPLPAQDTMFSGECQYSCTYSHNLFEDVKPG